MQLPIRIRLTISYFVIFLVAGTLLCFASYWMARRSLYIAFDHELDEHIDDVHDFLAANRLGADEAQASAELTAEFAVKDDGKWLQIADDEGRWIYRAHRMMLAPHDLPHGSALPSAGSFLEFNAGGKQVRSLQRAFTVDGRTFVAESGATLTKTDQTLALYRNGLLLIFPIVLVSAGVTGHLLSRRALAPVAAIAREAQRIHDASLQLRLPQLDTHDELAHLSSTLNEMLERIESGVRSVSEFTAYASHELRTPVALIRTEADLALQFDRTPHEYREAIAIIGSEAQHMSSLLDSLLFLARADAGTESARLEPIDARSICLEAFDKWRPLLAKARLLFRFCVPEHPVSVLADSAYLQRLLNILLENAGKYTPAGGAVTLELSVDGSTARCSVTDTGIGIPLKDQSHIFERFRRASNVQEADAPGSGLGLALAAWIARHHRTELRVDSTPGHGSTFAFELQIVPERESPTAGKMTAPLAKIPNLC
jgi:signal transduction histidine kinase